MAIKTIASRKDYLILPKHCLAEFVLRKENEGDLLEFYQSKPVHEISTANRCLCLYSAVDISHPKWRMSNNYAELCVMTSLASAELLSVNCSLWTDVAYRHSSLVHLRWVYSSSFQVALQMSHIAAHFKVHLHFPICRVRFVSWRMKIAADATIPLSLL